LPQEDIHQIDIERLQIAIDELMEAAGYELKGESGPVLGSWWQKFLFGRKDDKSQTALETLRDVFLSVWSGSAPAHHTAELANATSNVIKSLKPFDRAAIRFGQFVTVKITRDGKPMLRVETLSAALARRLADNPQFLLRPEEVWAALDTQEPEEPDQSQLEAPEEPPNLPAPGDTQTRRVGD
jgi:hypothetical protein